MKPLHVDRNWNTGRYIRGPRCDACNKPTGTEYFTDDEVCEGGDGPGFHLCARKRCIAARRGTIEQRRELYTRTRNARR